jgi:hypothetical protein
MKKFFSVVIVLLAVASIAGADYYVKSKYHSDPMNMPGANQPAKDEIHEQWIGGDKFANITPDMTIIMDLAKSKAWLVNHKNKNYVETDLPLDIAKLLPPEMASMMSMMKPSVSVEATGQKKTIGQWACSGYIVTITMMMTIKMTVWATEQDVRQLHQGNPPLGRCLDGRDEEGQGVLDLPGNEHGDHGHQDQLQQPGRGDLPEARRRRSLLHPRRLYADQVLVDEISFKISFTRCF